MPAKIRIRAGNEKIKRMRIFAPSYKKFHQIMMFVMLKALGIEPLRGSFAVAFLTGLFMAVLAKAQTTPPPSQNSAATQTAADHYYEPLPQETGENGLKLALRKLQTTGRLMQVDAHPDDEDGGMLTLEARGKGVSTLLMTLNRGEGGQNELGSNLFDVLGIVRTLEVLAADRYYGIEQRFSRVADFGYSKTPEETFQKWGGHDVALADIVRVVRTFRPDVLIARFSGTERDGHGHHQASAILTKEAFRAAADPNRFPEQIKEGLQPWQPKKLYIGNVCGFGASTCDAANYTVKLNTGKEDPLLGMSYVQFAVEGLRHQRSQALGGVSVPKGDRFAYYKLIDSVVDSPKDKDGHEQDFFDGIDTTLPGLASQLGDEEKKVPELQKILQTAQTQIHEVLVAKDLTSTRASLDDATATLLTAYPLLQNSNLSPQMKRDSQLLINNELSKLNRASTLVEGVTLTAEVEAPVGASPEQAFTAVPGGTFEATVRLTASERVERFFTAVLIVPRGWRSEEIRREKQSATELVIHFRVHVPDDAAISRPYWHRNNPETDSLNTIDDSNYQTLPFTPPPVKVSGTFGMGKGISSVCMVRYKDSAGNITRRPLAVTPAFSVLLDPSEQVIPQSDGPSLAVKADVHDNIWSEERDKSAAILAIDPPNGWQKPPSQDVKLDSSDQSLNFKLTPGTRRESRTQIVATLENGRHTYKEGYSVVTRDDLGTAYYYQPAVQRVSIVDVKVPHDLKLGYIMGAGDDIPTILQQIGMDVTLIPADKLATEDLSKYQTIVLGIRAYDTQKDVIANNQRLLDYVKQGGRLVVQYNTMGSFGVPIDFNSGKYTPYPATLSRDRVTVEEAPVTILDPSNPIFHSPNEITQKDFDGWVQERGLYFMSQWDPQFTPLLESHDPSDEESCRKLREQKHDQGTDPKAVCNFEKKGGLLLAHYGKGTYIYTGYAFFRQLPAGVPGAVRLFVNLVSSH
jgi:LmbE family N-acetylglucosaminyl deacetylase